MTALRTGETDRAIRLARALRGLASNPGDVTVLTGMVGWALVLPILKRVLPLPRLVRLMWTRPRVRRRDRERERRSSALATRLYRSEIAGLDNNCLERSLVTYRVLARMNANPWLIVGVAKGDAGVLGHVWVTVEGQPVGESPEALDAFHPVIAFGANGIRDGASSPVAARMREAS